MSSQAKTFSFEAKIGYQVTCFKTGVIFKLSQNASGLHYKSMNGTFPIVIWEYEDGRLLVKKYPATTIIIRRQMGRTIFTEPAENNNRTLQQVAQEALGPNQGHLSQVSHLENPTPPELLIESHQQPLALKVSISR